MLVASTSTGLQFNVIFISVKIETGEATNRCY